MTTRIKKTKALKELEKLAWKYWRKHAKNKLPQNCNIDKVRKRFFALPEGKAYKEEMQRLHGEFWELVLDEFKKSEIAKKAGLKRAKEDLALLSRKFELTEVKIADKMQSCNEIEATRKDKEQQKERK